MRSVIFSISATVEVSCHLSVKQFQAVSGSYHLAYIYRLSDRMLLKCTKTLPICSSSFEVLNSCRGLLAKQSQLLLNSQPSIVNGYSRFDRFCLFRVLVSLCIPAVAGRLDNSLSVSKLVVYNAVQPNNR